MINIGIGIPFGQRSAGIDPQAKIAFDSLQSAGFTTPQGITGINAAFKTIKTIYGTSDITTAISFFGDPSLAYQIGAGSGTTLGQAIRTLPNIIDPTRATDAVQTTAASQPLLLVHEGVNYWFGVNVAGNYVGTSATVTAATQLDVVAYVIASPAHVNSTTIISNDGTARNFVFNCVDVSAGTLQLRAGTPFTSYNSTVGVGNFNNYSGWIRATYNQNGINGDVTFYTSSDSPTTNYNSLNWTQLGSIVTSASTGLQTGTSSIQVGANNTTNNFQGKISRATISNSIGGAPVVDFNPNQYNPSTSQTQWTSSTGEVWTINTGTATTGYKGVLVDRTIVQGDGVDDSLATSSTINLGSVFTLYAAFKGYNNEGGSGRITFGKQNIDGAVFRNSLVNIGSWIGAGGGIVLNQTATSLNLNLATFKRKVSSNTLQVNNGAIATNTGTNPIVQSNISVFFATSYGFSNSLITSGIISKLEDDTTQKTSMYNYIRSINNNAF